MTVPEQTLAELEHWSYAVETPFRPVHELLAAVDGGYAGEELVDHEVWTGSGDQVLFRETVLRAHLERRRKRKGNPGRDLNPDELAPVAGTDVRMRRDAAAAAGRLLAAANAALTAAQSAGDEDARRTVRITASSGYRGRAHQEALWRRYFTRYYNETQRGRAVLPGGPHGPAAVTYLVETYGIPRRIAAPGYSNHQNGIAIDFLQRRKPGRRIRNSTAPAAVRAWRATWFFTWLRQNAESFGFRPYEPEPWHWEFRSGSGPQQEAWTATHAESATDDLTDEELLGPEEAEEGEDAWAADVDALDEIGRPAFEDQAELEYDAEDVVGDEEMEDAWYAAGDASAGAAPEPAEEHHGLGDVTTATLVRPESEPIGEPEFDAESRSPDHEEYEEYEDGFGAQVETTFPHEATVDPGGGEVAEQPSPMSIAQAAIGGELLLEDDLLEPMAWITREAEEQQAAGGAGQQPGGPAQPPAQATRLEVSVRTDFTTRTTQGVRHDWRPGEPVRGARAQITGTPVNGVTNAQGLVRLDTTGLTDGFHTLRIEHTDPARSTNDLTGPAVADGVANPPDRIYRPLNIWLRTRNGRITWAMVAWLGIHGGLGNRHRSGWDATHLPIDWKPVWMRSPLKNGERMRPIADVDLVVVHRPDRPQIGPAINTFLNVQEAGNAHYLIDHNGHVIKLAEDGRRANHAGFSRWRGRRSLNEVSIGIEVMKGAQGFAPGAMGALVALLERLRAAYPTIPAHRIVGHSDIATSQQNPTLLSNRRLDDPGSQFDWATLEARRLGMRPGPVAVGNAYSGIFAAGQPAVVLRAGDHDPGQGTPARLGGTARPDVIGTPIADLQADLEHIGYSVRPPGGTLGRFDPHTEAAVDRFQRHFFSGSRAQQRPALGRVDALTAGWIRAVRPAIP